MHDTTGTVSHDALALAVQQVGARVAAGYPPEAFREDVDEMTPFAPESNPDEYLSSDFKTHLHTVAQQSASHPI